MAQKYLIINIGSQSKKCALFASDGALIRSVHLEDEHYRDDVSDFFQEPEELMVGVRVVAPGAYFTSHRLIDDEYLAKLGEVAEANALHVAPVLAEIRQIRELYPAVPIYALSDSALLATRPLTDKLYGLPPAIAQRLGLYRWGYHGLSIASVTAQLKSASLESGKTVVCHLGGGVSVVALRDGGVVSTSMGYSPLEGPVMSSRVGNIDAAAVLALPAEELLKYFNHECGLLGLSGRSSSVRELLELEANGDGQAKLTLETFVWQIRKHVGAAIGLLGGIDTLVLTATIGERSVPIRQRLLAGWEGLGLILDQEKNQALTVAEVDQPQSLHADQSRVKIVVVAAAEEREMYRALRAQI